jgi:basic membrane protein A and related proteins
MLRVKYLVFVAASVSLLLVAFGAAGSVAADSARSASPKIALIINGNLGDGGFFDEANAGVVGAAKKFNLQEKSIETGYDPTKWAPALQDAAAGNYDVIIAGSFGMQQLVEQAAAQHPEKKFVLFDVAYDPKGCNNCKNIYSVIYRYRETGFLAGSLAALMVKAKLPALGGKTALGFVGGQDIPVIEDYKKGWQLGAKYVLPKVKLYSAFAGSFADPVKGKQLGQNMISSGAAILFTASGATDKGVIQAAATGHSFAIGNSPTQALTPVVNGKLTVVTSSATSVQTSLFDAVKLASAGNLPVGSVRSFGVKQGTNYIVNTPTYRKVVPASIRAQMARIVKLVGQGKFKSQLGG